MTLASTASLSVREQATAEIVSNPQAWAGLPCDSFMRSPIWSRNAWEHYHRVQPGVDPSSLRPAVVCDEDGRLLGRSVWFRQLQQTLACWRLVGSGAICNDYVQIPCQPDTERQVGVATARWLHRQPRRSLGGLAVIEVDGHRADSIQWQAFFRTLCAAGWSLDSVPIQGAWCLELPNTWHDYEMRLGKSQRRKARCALKMLGSGKLQHEVYRTAAEIAREWPEFVRLHQKRRQLLGQTGCFANSDYERFLKNAVIELAVQGSAWLSVVRASQQTLGVLLVFDSGDTTYVYQSGIDTDWLHLNPGHLVNAATISNCIERGQRYFDFLRGDERYKSDWRAVRVDLRRSLLFSPGFTGRGLASVQKLRRSLLHWIKTRSHDQQNAIKALAPSESCG